MALMMMIGWPHPNLSSRHQIMPVAPPPTAGFFVFGAGTFVAMGCLLWLGMGMP
jgi:hypothetical protein